MATRDRPYRIAALSPDSPDPDARADAKNPALLRQLAAARKRVTPTSGRTTAQLEAADPLTADEEREVKQLLRASRAAERKADVVENATVRSKSKLTGRRTHLAGDVSGRLVVRFPKSVHRDLAKRADAEGVSLNQLVLTYVSRGLGADLGQ